MTSINRQLKRLVESGNPSPREVDKAVTRLAHDSTTNSAPPVRPKPMCEQPERPHDDNANVIPQALHRVVQQQQNRGALVTNGCQWQNVPLYRAKRKERLRHRPARAKTSAVQAHRQRIIRDTNSSLPSTALPRRRRTVRFTDGPTAKQVFQISQPATSIMSLSSCVAILPPGLNRREERRRKDRERKRRKREDPAFRKMEATKSAARMKAKRSNPIYREAEAARQRKKRNQQTLTKSDHEKRLSNARYIAAEYAFKMKICAVDPSLYIAGRVGDTNKDTTNRRKRIGRLANNKKTLIST